MKKHIKRIFTRIVIAFIGTILLIALILTFEAVFGAEKDCHPQESWIICQIRESVLLNVVESFSILIAVILFVLETPDRNKQAHYEAWKVIDSAHGLRTSYARLQALQDLNEDNVSLSGLNAPEADFRGINLAYADLSHADLSGADLSYANLSHAKLSHANLVETKLNNTNLKNAALTGANLDYASLIEAELQDVDFVGANLLGTNFVRANLTQAYFGDVNFKDALLRDANLKQTKFFGVNNLTNEQITTAINWREAIYDTALQKKLNLK